MSATTYSAGTISVGAGSTSVTGVSTSWSSAGVRAGDLLIAGTAVVPISAVNSATSITLSRGWTGGALSSADYDILMLDDAVRSLTSANALLAELTGGTLTSLAGVSSAADQVPYFTGVGVMGVTALTPAARALLDDTSAAAMRTTLGVAAAPASSVYGTYGGSANAITVTAGLSGIAVGTKVRFRASAANTGAATLNVDGSGAIPCRTITGAVLPAGYICTTVNTEAEYDGTYWVLGREIERGSNANGEYVRFADGTQICTCSMSNVVGPITTAEGAIWRSAEYAWTFPASFVTTANLAVHASTRAGGAMWSKIRLTSISSAAVTLLSGGSNSNLFSVDTSAIGRWY